MLSNDPTAKAVDLNRSQSLIHLVNANVTYCLWPRGSGKTSGGIGPRLFHLSQVMPRSQCIFYSDTYERLKKTLVPNIIDFFQNEMGLIEDQDFIKYRKPPEHWTKPLIPLDKFDYVISFRSGFALCLASAEVEGSANGYNAQSAIVDETKFVPEAKIKNELLKAVRGALKYFGHLPEYRSHWCFTDKWKGDIRWMKNKKEKASPELIKAIVTQQLKIFDLQNLLAEAKTQSAQYKYKNQIFQIETKLNAVRRELVYLSEAQPFENIDVLGEKYYRDMKRDCESILEYNVAVGNEDPDTVENTFYPSLSKKRHYYNHQNDTSEDQPLIAAMDYQWRITPMVVGQWGIIPGREAETINIINGVHTLHPDGGIEKTVKAFCGYYKHRIDKIVFYAYDHTATGRRPDGKSFKDTAISAWEDEGWIVIEADIGAAPEHDLKHEEIKKLMDRDRILFNETRLKDNALKSITHAGAVKSGNKTKKDKTQEKKLTNDPVQQTDYSDAFDMLVYAALVMDLIPYTTTSFTGDMHTR